MSSAPNWPCSRPASNSALASSVSSSSATVFVATASSVALTPFPPRGPALSRCRTVPARSDGRHRPNGSSFWRGVLRFSTCLKKRLSPLSKRGSWAFGSGQDQFSTGTRQVPEVDQEEAQVEANRLGMRETGGQRAEPGECERGAILVVEPDCDRGEGLGIVRRLA